MLKVLALPDLQTGGHPDDVGEDDDGDNGDGVDGKR